MPRRLLLGLVALGAIGLAVRWSWVLAVDPVVPEVGDAAAYHLLAEGLADGDGYVRPFDRVLFDEHRPTAEYAPLHPTVLAVAAAAGVDGVTGQRLWLSLFGAASVVATGVLAWRLSGRQAPAFVAAGIAALHPLWFQGDATLMSETLAALLGAATVTAAVEVVRRPTRTMLLLLGAGCALTALVRAEGLLLLLAVALPAALVGARRLRPGPPPWRVALVPFLAAAVVLAPWTIRNALRFDEVVAISTNAGSVIDGANCPETYGGELIGYWKYSDACFQGFTQQEFADRSGDESTVADEHRHEGTTYAFDNVDRWPAVAVARLGRTVALFRPSQMADLGALEGREQAADMAGYALLWATLALGVVGAARLRRAGQPWWVPAAAVAAVWGSTALTYGNPRFLAVAQPSLVALAACGATRR